MNSTIHNIAEAKDSSAFSSMKRSNWIDVLGGIILPVVCVVLDPFVFRSATTFPGGGGPLLGRYLVFGYGEILLGVIAFVLYRWGQLRSPFLAGVLLMGAAFAGSLGCILLPYAIFGVLVVIGLLGFSPFVSLFVFVRAYVRLHRLCLIKQPKTKVVQQTLLGLLFAFSLPLCAQLAVNALVDPAIARIVAGDTRVEARQTLRRLTWVADLDLLVEAYRKEQDVNKKEAIAKAYREITGSHIEERLQILND